MSIELAMPSNHLILCCPLLLLPSIFPRIKVFSKESVLHIRWPKYWSFSINPSNEYSGLISFRIDWFDLFAVQGTLKTLLQCHIADYKLQSNLLFKTRKQHPQKIILPLLSRFSHVRLCVTPHRWKPTRLPHPQDSPGKNTGVGCHFR